MAGEVYIICKRSPSKGRHGHNRHAALYRRRLLLFYNSNLTHRFFACFLFRFPCIFRNDGDSLNIFNGNRKLGILDVSFFGAEQRSRKSSYFMPLVAAKLRKMAKSPVLFPSPGGGRKQRNAFPDRADRTAASFPRRVGRLLRKRQGIAHEKTKSAVTA